MRDALTIKGKEIVYMNDVWTIGEFYYIPDNPNIYVKLSNGIVNLNVILSEISNLITNN